MHPKTQSESYGQRLNPVDPESLKQLVDDVTGDLSKWAPGEWPQRPAVLTFDDGQIVEAYKAKERGDRLGKDQRLQLEIFGRWRAAVFVVEGTGAGNLRVLMSVLSMLESADDWERADQVRAFVKHWYHFAIPSPVPRDWKWQEKASERFSENRRLLPVWLREMTRPPPGHGTRSGDEDPVPEAPKVQADLFAGEE